MSIVKVNKDKKLLLTQAVNHGKQPFLALGLGNRKLIILFPSWIETC